MGAATCRAALVHPQEPLRDADEAAVLLLLGEGFRFGEDAADVLAEAGLGPAVAGGRLAVAVDSYSGKSTKSVAAPPAI